MRPLLPKSFFGQLMLGTILVQTLFLGLFIWYTVVTQRKSAEGRTRERIVQQLNRLSAACSRELARGDTPALQNALELSRIAPTIEVARITDLHGKTLAVTQTGLGRDLDSFEAAVLPTAVHQQIFRIQNNQVEAVTPIELDGKPAALLWLEPNHALSQSTTITVVRIALTYGGFALLANIVPIFLIVRTITKPLHTLRAATDRVILDPDLNHGVPLPVTSTNEAGALTASFNAMLRELEDRRNGLLETLALLDSMLKNAPIGFAFFDRDLQYIRVNDFLANLHELTIADHIGRRPTGIYPDSVGEAKVHYLRQVFETGLAIRDIELSGEMPHSPGVLRNWLMHFYPVRTGDESIRWVGVIVVDTTEQRKSEEALRRTEKLATAGRLAASIAHEINNPLEAVTNLLYILRTHEHLDPAATSLVVTAEAELARVSEITQQTLRFYRQSTLPGPVNIAEVLSSILSLYQPRIASAAVTVDKRFRGEPEIFGFGGELRQLFANLVGNAIDAMQKGGTLHVRAHAGQGFDSHGTWREGVRIAISDTGTGMSEDTRLHIFEAFFTTKEATGTGLGLWVSEEIVRKHAGTVRVRSRQTTPSGTTFLIFLPNRSA